MEGAHGRVPTRPNFFVFMQFLGILSHIISWRPHLGNTGSATDIKRCQASKTELQDRVREKVFFRLIDYHYINFRSKLTSKLKTYIFIPGKTKLLETKHQRRKASQTLKRDKTDLEVEGGWEVQTLRKGAADAQRRWGEVQQIQRRWGDATQGSEVQTLKRARNAESKLQTLNKRA